MDIKKSIVFFALFGLTFLVSKAQQKEGANWLFGYGARIGFAAGYPVADTNSNQRSNFGCGTISDAQGNLLFYTNGSTVWNRKNQVMPNGTGLLETDTNKSVLIQKKPGSQNLYYIFVANNPVLGDLNTGRLYYSIVDMNLNNGLGDVVPMMKNILLAPRVARMLAAAQHQNNQDFWIIAHGYPITPHTPGVYWLPGELDSTFYAYKLSSSGIESNPVISYDGNRFGLITSIDRKGSMRTSPNSKLLTYFVFPIQTVNGWYSPTYNFNRNSGYISSFFYARNAGVENCKSSFSPDSKYLFIAEGGGRLVTYDLSLGSSGEIDASGIVSVLDNYNLMEPQPILTDAQIGLDGKLYVNPYQGATFLSRMNFPCKRFGPDIGWESRAVDLKGRKCGLEFPVHNQTLFVNVDKLQAQAARDTICLGDSVEILAYGAGAERFSWFRNNETTLLDTGAILKVAPTVNTIYKVRGIGTCAGVKDTSIQIVVLPRPTINMGAGTKACGGKTFTYTYPSQNNYRYLWQSDIGTGNFTTKGFLQLSVFDRDTAWNGKIKLTLSNPGCSVSDSISVRVNPTPKTKPILSPSPDTSICQGQNAVLTASSLNNLKWLWSGGDTTKSIAVSAQGNYSCRYKSEAGCVSDSISTVRVNVNPLPITQTLSNNKKDSTLCFPAQIQLGINPEPNISYTWQGDSLGNNLISNPIFQFANLDTIVLTRNLKLRTRNQITGCSNLDSLTITLVPNLRPFAGPDKSFCAENQAIIGQKGFSGFVYQWSPATGLQNPQSAQTRTNIENPSYENELNQAFIRTVSLLGCEAKDTVEVRVFPKVPKPQLAGPQFVCPGVRNVPYQFSTIPAISGFQVSSFRFQISGGDSVGKWFVNWNEENENGGIKMKLGNIYGCQPDSVFLPVSITRNLRPQTQIWAGTNDSICLAAAQNIKYEIQNFNPQSRYNWSYSPNSVTSNPTLNFELSTFNAPGIYNLTLSESDTTPIARCFGKTDYQIRIWPQPEPSLILGRDSVCENSGFRFQVQGFRLGSRFDWTAAKGLIENVVSNGAEVDYSADFRPDGDFETIEISNTETSDKGCIGPENKKIITVESLPNPKIEALDGPIKWDALLQNFRAIGRSQSQFYWTAENGELQSAQGLQNALVAWLPNQTFYSLQVKESTALGCEGESEKLLPEINKTLFFPNLITANGDEKNDHFRIENLHFYPENELEIYNRWGKKVFSASPYLNNWPREKQISGIYFFLFKSTNGQHQAGQILILH